MATIGWIKVGAAVDTSQFAKGMAVMTSLTAKFKAAMTATSAAIKMSPLDTFKSGTIMYAQGMTTAVQKTMQMGRALSYMKDGINQTKLWYFRKSIQGIGVGLAQAAGGLAVTSVGLLKMGAAVALPIARFAAFKVILPTIAMTGKAIWATAGMIGSAMAKVASSIASGIYAITKWGIALGALATGALIAWTRHSIGAAAEQGNLAKRLGMTTENFQKLGYAAKLSGVDQDQLTTSLEKMEERLAEVAISGAGPAAEALKRFGVNARVLTEMGGAEAFMVLVGTIEKIPNAMERIAVAKDVFGKSGQGMVNLALQGTDALKKMGMEASSIGVAMNAIDNAKLGEANQGFIKISSAVEGIGNQIAVVLAPYVTAVSDQFIQWMKTGVNTGSYISQAVDWITTAVGYAADAWQLFTTGFLTIRAGFDAFISMALAGLDKLIESFGWLFEKITGTKIELGTFLKDWSELMAKSGENDIAEALKRSAQPWAHEVAGQFVRKLRDEIETGAQKRAEFAAGKQGALGAPGSPVTAKVAETKFAAAAEQGTAAAYSARVGAQARLFDSKQNLIVENTGKTAAATERIAIAVEAGKMRAGGPVDGIQYREQASGR